MVNPRQQHLQKTKQERSEYYDNVIRKPGPTLEDTKPIIDSTDQPTAKEKIPTAPFTPTKPPSPIGQFVREKWIELILGLIGIFLVAIISWSAHTIFSLNREIGVLDQRVGNLETTKENSQKFQEWSDDLDRLERRLDNHIDRHQVPTKK